MQNKTIDKVVYSLWTKPSGNILTKAINWYSPKAQLLCLALSVLKSAENFKEVELITDSEGWEIIKKLNLPFTSVKTILDDIPSKDYGFWALGKIYAYKAQDKPFIHLDYDAILWKKLPDWVLNADLFVQNTEDGEWFKNSYKPEINYANKILGYFPPNWGVTEEAYCTGIFGGTDIDFIQKYCDEVFKFLYNLKNKKGWDSVNNKGCYCIIFEQYLLACMAENNNIEVTYFDKYLDKKKLTGLGYTHLWGAKKEANIEDLLLNALNKHYPGSSNRILNLF